MNDADLGVLRRLQQAQRKFQENKIAPSLAERARSASQSDLKAFLELKRDPSPRSLLLKQAAMLRMRQKRLAACARAWSETVQPYVNFDVSLIDLSRGKLVVAVANHAHKYQLHTALRGGRQRHFQQRCSAPVADVHIVVGAAPPLATTAPRSVRSLADQDREVQDHIAAGEITPDQASLLADDIARAEQIALRHDDGLSVNR